VSVGFAWVVVWHCAGSGSHRFFCLGYRLFGPSFCFGWIAGIVVGFGLIMSLAVRLMMSAFSLDLAEVIAGFG
jgi:hypothetical protein